MGAPRLSGRAEAPTPAQAKSAQADALPPVATSVSQGWCCSPYVPCHPWGTQGPRGPLSTTSAAFVGLEFSPDKKLREEALQTAVPRSQGPHCRLHSSWGTRVEVEGQHVRPKGSRPASVTPTAQLHPCSGPRASERPRVAAPVRSGQQPRAHLI